MFNLLSRRSSTSLDGGTSDAVRCSTDGRYATWYATPIPSTRLSRRPATTRLRAWHATRFRRPSSSWVSVTTSSLTVLRFFLVFVRILSFLHDIQSPGTLLHLTHWFAPIPLIFHPSPYPPPFRTDSLSTLRVISAVSFGLFIPTPLVLFCPFTLFSSPRPFYPYRDDLLTEFGYLPCLF